MTLTLAISSDQYFQRGGYDPTLSAETQARLATFHGREEDEEDELQERDDFRELEESAKAYYRKFMSNPDVQMGIEKIRSGALKVCASTHHAHSSYLSILRT